MNKKIEVSVDIIKEEVKKEVVAEIKEKEKPPIALLSVCVLGKNIRLKKRF
ncbi:MAG: hypothetical protein ACRCZ9_00190 [Fusobacteriaceae bacterium]